MRPTARTRLARTIGGLAAAAALLVAFAGRAVAADAAATEPADADSPWGIAASSGSARDRAAWFPKVAAAGATSVRLFPEWRALEPARGDRRWEAADAVLASADEHRLRVNGILMGSTPWASKKAHAFPMDHLDDWSAFVSAAVGRYRGRVRDWEVWNEGNGGFNDDHHTSADYAALAAAAHAAAKRADPDARVGLTVASYDPAYLHQAILAMKRQEVAGAFDFLCVHPYEVADGLADPDGEVPYLWMGSRLRGLVRAAAPEKADVPIWVTEVGRRVETRGGRTTTEADAAKALVKLYVMSAAQGIARTQWFEGQDPAGEDAGFGLLKRDGSPRAAYAAYSNLTRQLGPRPTYLGWVALGDGGRGYGFAFQGAAGPVLVAWMPAGATANLTPTSLAPAGPTPTGPATVVDALTGRPAEAKSGQPIPLTDSPLYLVGVGADLVATARANADKPFPWGGDHAGAAVVRLAPDGPGASPPPPSAAGAPPAAGERPGVFQTNRWATPHCTFADGSGGPIVRGDQAVSFYAHPSFADLSASEFYVRVTVRRLAPGNLGMNLVYEVADSQGRTPYKNAGVWFAVPAGDGWHSHAWRVTGACLATMWGHDFAVRPEQSVPFVIGNVEVSRGPFR
jgi:hypothetical protein